MEYRDIFRHRGESYDLAMKKYPDVRNKEFEQLFHNIPLKNNETILDIPALGGYLKKYCLPDTNVLFLDFSQSINGIDVVSPYEKWDIEPVDRLVCLAAVHHVENLNYFLQNLSLHVKKNGFVHIADVSINSRISKFLDDFVGPNTSTGEHKGNYYDWKKIDFPKSLQVIDIEERNCPWVFQSESEMIEYCKLLFDLKSVRHNEVLSALKQYVGIENNNNSAQIKWHLTYVDLINF